MIYNERMFSSDKRIEYNWEKGNEQEQENQAAVTSKRLRQVREGLLCCRLRKTLTPLFLLGIDTPVDRVD